MRQLLQSSLCLLYFVCFSLLSFSQEEKEKKESILYSWSEFDKPPIVELPVTVAPFARGDLLFPLGEDKKNVPFIGVLGGNYLVFPSSKIKIGLLFGFSFGGFHENSFSGKYNYDGVEQNLKVKMTSKLRNTRIGLKFINHTSNKRIKPYLELYFSNTVIFTRLNIDESKPNPDTPMIESRMVSYDKTPAYHLNSGVEINLMSNENINKTEYKGQGAFLYIGLGYLHGRNSLKHLDIRNATNDQSVADESKETYVEVYSSEINFSKTIPQNVSKIRFLNLSFGFIFRI